MNKNEFAINSTKLECMYITTEILTAIFSDKFLTEENAEAAAKAMGIIFNKVVELIKE